MKRVIVAGGTGFFGRAVLEMLSQHGIRGLAASRRGGRGCADGCGTCRLPACGFSPGDLVIDTVGPFQDRTTTLVEAALTIGCDLIDISDSLAYAQRIFALREKIADAGIRVLPSCSSVSVVTAMLVADCGIASPIRVSGFLAPSARYSASAATAESLLRSIGRPVQVWQDGRLEETARMAEVPTPFIAQADRRAARACCLNRPIRFWLPYIWPSLRDGRPVC